MAYKKYRSRIVISLLFITIVFASSCSTSGDKQNSSSITLIEEWFPSACFAGDMFALNETAEKYNLKLEIKPGADDIDPLKLVLGGTADFGIAGGDRILTANAKGADLVVLGAINYKSPACFIALEDRNITRPEDFESHVIGVMTGNNTEYVYRALLKKTGIDPSLLKEVEAPYDLGSFISGAFDVRPAFIYDELVSLDQKGIAYDVIKPEEYGVAFVGPVLFAKRSFVEKNDALVQSFVNSMAEGWQKALDQPEQSIRFLKAYDSDIDVTRELLSLKKGMEYFSGEDGKPLYLSYESWAAFTNQLVDLGLIGASEKNLNCFNNSFILNYYEGGY